jgi:hypothetical protein
MSIRIVRLLKNTTLAVAAGAVSTYSTFRLYTIFAHDWFDGGLLTLVSLFASSLLSVLFFQLLTVCSRAASTRPRSGEDRNDVSNPARHQPGHE